MKYAILKYLALFCAVLLLSPAAMTLIFISATYLFAKRYRHEPTRKSAYFRGIFWSLVWLYANLAYRLFGRQEPIPVQKQETAIYLLPGFLDTPYAFWRLRRHLAKEGIKAYPIAYRRSFSSIREIAKDVCKMILLGNPQKIKLVGYSMGGIVAAYVNEYLLESKKAEQVVIVASPLQGTVLANIAFGMNAKEMRPQNDHLLLKELREKIEQNHNTKYNILLSKNDNIILPWYRAKLKEDESQHTHQVVEDFDHASMILSKENIELISQYLKAK